MKHRFLANLFTTRRALRRAFPTAVLDRIEASIRQSERQHSAELRFAVETALDPATLLRGVSARERAIEAFAKLHTWDTEANNGVLIYVLLSEHDIEIVADRGYNDRVSAEQWQAVCQEMEAAFRQGNFEQGALDGIERITALIRQHFPPRAGDENELPDRPSIL
jgi:uncharacterized membrane protein